MFMSRLVRFAILVGLFFSAGNAFAQGGTCPAGATYPNTSTAATGALTTLSAAGVTNCYFVSAAGLDTNKGTTEQTPWLHVPGMSTCANNCLALQKAGVPPGTGFIFRGGDAWHFGNSSTSPYTGGTFDWNALDYSGSSARPLYLGVDQTWYSGAAWARPVFTGDNPVCGPQNVGGGCYLNSANSINEYYVGSCAYQVGKQNVMINFNNVNYATIDGVEITGLCQQDFNGSLEDYYINYSASQGNIYNNLYIHGWTHLQFGNHASPTSCTDGSVCFGIFAFYGGQSGAGSPSETLTYDVLDGSDSDPRAGGMCYCDWWQVSYSVFNNTTQAIVRDIHLFHDNVQQYIYDNGHGNQLEAVGENNGANAVYNNVWRNLAPNGVSLVGVWLLPTTGNTDYVFNNVENGVAALQMHNIGNHGSSNGTYQYFNNTIETDVSQMIFGCQYLDGAFIDTNQHLIDAASPYSSPCNSHTVTTDVAMSNSAAASGGYTGSQTFVYSPTSSSSPTVEKGTNEQSYCTALSTAGLSAAASACQADTTYACAYNSSSHNIICPARTAVPRPGSTAWDVGAYQFRMAPNPPTGVTGAVSPR